MLVIIASCNRPGCVRLSWFALDCLTASASCIVVHMTSHAREVRRTGFGADFARESPRSHRRSFIPAASYLALNVLTGTQCLADGA